MINVVMTGFGPFGGVPDNPSAVLAHSVMENHPTSHSWRVVKCKILEVSKQACDTELMSIFDTFKSSSNSKGEGKSQAVEPSPIFLHVHLGVHSGANCFHVERKAYNIDDFRIPDNNGVQIRGKRISHAIQSETLNTSIDVQSLCAELLSQDAIKHRDLKTPQNQDKVICTPSSDPGRFLCNHVYFKSMEHCTHHDKHHSIFIHVPPFRCMSKDVQIRTLLLLLDTLCERFDTFCVSSKPVGGQTNGASHSENWTPSVDIPAGVET